MSREGIYPLPHIGWLQWVGCYKNSSIALLCFCCLSLSHLRAEQADSTLWSIDNSTIPIPISIDSLSPEIRWAQVLDQRRIERMRFHPNSQKALWYSALLPGAGQVYNRKYWKIPIVLGGVAGLAYAISWNGQMYTDYYNGYRDLIDNNPETNRYLDLLPKGSGRADYDKNTLINTFNNKQQAYRRNRDLSIIGTVGVYLLVILDAYVDAQLYNFDISPDISIKVHPSIIGNDRGYIGSNSLGSLALQCSLSF